MTFKDRLTQGTRSIGLTRSVTESMLFRLTGMVLVFLLHLLLARLLGAKGYGDYTIVLTWLNVLLVISLSGFDQSVLGFLPQALARKDFGKAHGFIRFSGRWITSMALLGSLGIFVFLVYNSRKGHESFSEAMLWAMFTLPLLAYVYRSSSLLKAFHRIKASMTPISVVFPLLMAAACGYYYWEHGMLTVDAALLQQFACTVVVSLLIRRAKSRRLREKMERTEAEYDRGEWLRTASSFMLGSLFQLLLLHTDILIIGYLGTHAQAGYYAVAVRITSLVVFGLSVTDYVFLPPIREAIHEGKKKQLQKLVIDASRQILLMAVPLLLLLVVTGSFLLSGFGKRFETAAYVPMLILLAGQAVNAATGLSAGLLSAAGYRNVLHIISGAAAVLQLALTFLLVPVLGITGAAVSATAVRILLNWVASREVRKRIGVQVRFW